MWLIAHITFARKHTVKCLHLVMIPFINICDTYILCMQETDKNLQKQLWGCSIPSKGGVRHYSPCFSKISLTTHMV